MSPPEATQEMLASQPSAPELLRRAEAVVGFAILAPEEHITFDAAMKRNATSGQVFS